MKRTALVVVVMLSRRGRAHAYPSFSSAAIRCASSATSPAGGGMLNENGRNSAERSRSSAPAGVHLSRGPAAPTGSSSAARSARRTATCRRRSSTSSGFRCRPISTRAPSSRRTFGSPQPVTGPPRRQRGRDARVVARALPDLGSRPPTNEGSSCGSAGSCRSSGSYAEHPPYAGGSAAPRSTRETYGVAVDICRCSILHATGYPGSAARSGRAR